MSKILQLLETNEFLTGEKLVSALGVECIPDIWLRDRMRVFGFERNLDYIGDADSPWFLPHACILIASTAQTFEGDRVREMIFQSLNCEPK